MRKSRFTEEQIIKVLKEHAAGLSAGEACRKYGVSDATFYKWRSRYGGMEIKPHRDLVAVRGYDARTIIDLIEARGGRADIPTCRDREVQLGRPRPQSATQSDRPLLQRTKSLPPRRHALRQDRSLLPRGRPAGSHRSWVRFESTIQSLPAERNWLAE